MNSARDWKQEHAGFHYPSFYNFIVDFFENAEDNNSTSVVNKLLQWWNRYVLYPSITDTRCSNGAVSLQQKFSSHRSSCRYRCFMQRIEVICEEA
jgi:hypothetical protein